MCDYFLPHYTKHMKKTAVTLVAMLFATLTFAQKIKTSASGRVVNKVTQAPIEFVNVVLLNKKDSAFIAGTVTDKNGKFSIEDILPGDYLLRCSYIGYTATAIQDLSFSGEQKNIILETINMNTDAKRLDEVVVTSSKSILNTSIDRKSYDVTKDIMAQSGTASDVLKNVPSVEVDMDGNLSLRGAGNVMILIHGQPSPLFSKLNQAEVLQQFPASSIERIEVITNPSARYKPDGTSGIINIILKKNVKGGFNGSIAANAGNRNRYNGSTTLNYNPGKMNVFGTIGIRKDNRNRTNSVTRAYFDSTAEATRGYYTEEGISHTRPLTTLATFGFAYTPNKNNSFGLSGNYSNRSQTKNDVNTKIFSDQTHAYTSYFDRLRYDPENENEKDATAFYEHKFLGEDHSVRVEFNVAKSKDVEENHYQNKYRYPGNYSTFDNTNIFQGSRQQQLTIDYSRSISETEKMEWGYAGSFTQQDFNFYGEYFDFALGSFIKDQVRTNQFLFNQSLHALYGTYQKQYKKFGYSLGLRLEQSVITGHQVTQDTFIHNDYLKLYPTVHFAYQLKENSQLQLNYSRRVNRPEGDDLNPFPEYQDPYNVRAGNAKLLPEIIHSLEFGYKWQNKHISVVPSLYYRYKLNGFTQVTVPLSDSVLLTTLQNLSNDQSLGLELIVSAKVGKWLSSNLSTNFFYNQITATNLGYFGKRDILSFNANFNSTLTITPNTMAQVNATYYSSRVTPQGERYPTFILNIGVRQDFLKKKMSAILTASDLLKTLWQKTALNTTYLKELAIGRRDTQVVYLGVSYRFGKSLKKNKEEKLQIDTGN